MVGRELGDFFVRTRHEPGDVALRVEGLGRAGAFEDVTFDVRAGEVVGFAGLVGSGRTEVGVALFGVAPADERHDHRRRHASSQIRSPARSDAASASPTSPRTAAGSACRCRSRSPRNITLAGAPQLSSRRWAWSIARPSGATAERVPRPAAHPHAVAVDTPVGNLSGGNQQKVMLAKWLDVEPTVLILDEPTRGIDVGAKADVHQLIGDLAAAGVAVILISSDLPEVLAMSDRVARHARGPPDGHLRRRASLEQERIMTAAVASSERRSSRGRRGIERSVAAEVAPAQPGSGPSG